jgi:membrane protein required for colicin V production
MKIDLAIVVVVFFFAFLGAFSGAIRQIANLGGLVAGYFGARPLGLLAGPFVAAKFGYPLLFSSIGCTFVLFFAIYLLTVGILRLVLGRIFPDGEKGAANRLGGFLLGGAKSGALVFVALSALVLVEKPIARLWHDYSAMSQGSVLIPFARHHSLFASIPQVAALEKLVSASTNPESTASLAESPDFKELAKDPRMKSLVDDNAVRRAFADGDYAALLSSVKVLKVLNDPRLSEQLAKAGSAEASPAHSPSSGAGAAKAPAAKPRAKRQD